LLVSSPRFVSTPTLSRGNPSPPDCRSHAHGSFIWQDAGIVEYGSGTDGLAIQGQQPRWNGRRRRHSGIGRPFSVGSSPRNRQPVSVKNAVVSCPLSAGDCGSAQTYTFKAKGEGENDLVFVYKVRGSLRCHARGALDACYGIWMYVACSARCSVKIRTCWADGTRPLR
jgi:hypothetical protein